MTCPPPVQRPSPSAMARAAAVAAFFLALTACGGGGGPSEVAPAFEVDPAAVSVAAGESASFTVSAVGTPAPALQWQRDDGAGFTDVAGATSGTLTFATAPADDGARFRAVATSSAGSATSAAAALTVTHLLFSAQPSARTVVAPAAATFSALADGTPAPAYQWQRSADGGSTWADVAGATAASYTSGATSLADDGARYRVRATNGVSPAVISAAATLTVHQAPAIGTPPASITLTPGDTASFTVAVTANPAPTYAWQRSTDGLIWFPVDGATSATLAFVAAGDDDGARFRVIVSNGVGDPATSAEALLTVTHLRFSGQPADRTVVAPAAATFSALADGTPAPAYQWQRSTDGGSTWADVAGATAASYTSGATSLADDGARYRVRATNGVSPDVTSAAATLTVHQVPAIGTQPASVTLTAGDAAELGVVATGNPAPEYRWERTQDGITWTAVPGATAAIYQLDPVALSDDGAQLRCVVTNAVGTATSQAALLTVKPVPAIATFTATPASIRLDQSSTLHLVFSGGTGVVTPGDLAVTSGVDVAVSPRADVTYTLTVSNGAGRAATASAPVHYDPRRGVFAATGALSAARAGATATLLPDGRVAIIGGLSPANAPLATAELYDPADGTFTLAAGTMAHARARHGAALLPDGRVLVAGGAGSPGTAELFDPATGTFTSAGAMQAPHDPAAALLLDDGRVLVSGAQALETYDPAAGTFTYQAAPSARREEAVVRLAGGDVLLAGGWSNFAIDAVERWSRSTGLVSALGTLRTPRMGPAAVRLADGRVLVAAGADGSGNTAGTGEVLDAGTGLTSALVAMVGGERHPAAVRLPSGKVLLAGDGLAATTGAELFDPAAGAFAATNAMTRARGATTATLLRDGSVLLAGGEPDRVADRYDPEDPGATAPAPSAALTAPAVVAPGATGLTASVPAQAGARYVWQVRFGTITAGQGTHQITFDSATGGAVVDVLVESDLGIPAHARAVTRPGAPGTWVRIADGPQLTQAAVAYDPGQRRAVLFGGNVATPPAEVATAETWEWDGAAWTLVSPSGDVPPARLAHGMAFDRASGEAVVHGGWFAPAAGDPAPYARATGTYTYRLDTHAWTYRGESLGSVDCYAIGYDTDAGRVRIFSGQTVHTDVWQSEYFPDVWTWDPATEAWPAVAIPPAVGARIGARWAYDAGQHRFVLFGGGVVSGTDPDTTWCGGYPCTYHGDTWEYDPGTDAWTAAAVSGDQPPATAFFGMVHDPARQRTVAYLGLASALANAPAAAAETWEYDGAAKAWRRVAGADQPGQLDVPTLFYDEVREAVLLVGGATEAGMSGGTWQYVPEG